MESPFAALIGDRNPAAGAGGKIFSIANDRSTAAADFSKVIGRWSPSKDGDRAQQAREIAEELVAVTFVQPLLKQLRDTNHAAEPFAPSQGEKQFRSMHDAVLAQRIVKASRFPLVERLAGDLLRKSEQAAATPTIEVHG